jgi:hypothetical protein
VATVRDAAELSRSGLPVVILVADRFASTARAAARTAQVESVPIVLLPYPLAGTGDANLARVAREVTPALLHALGVSAARAPGRTADDGR